MMMSGPNMSTEMDTPNHEEPPLETDKVEAQDAHGIAVMLLG